VGAGLRGDKELKKDYVNPKELPDWSNFFSQIVITEKAGLRLIFVSGQVGVDQAKEIVGDGSLKAQTEQAFKNLQTALNSVNADMADIVKLNIYMVNYRPEQAAIVGECLDQYFVKGKLPALSLIGVQSLALAAFLIEIDAEAIVDIG
jgi:enamine deaminase RidA (YjgF/YER057c/UK114 family)